MPPLKRTRHFDVDARIRHPEADHSDWVERVLRAPEETAPDPTSPRRTRHWGYIEEAAKYMRVVTEPGGAVLTAFFDRNYTRQRQREGRGEEA